MPLASISKTRCSTLARVAGSGTAGLCGQRGHTCVWLSTTGPRIPCCLCSPLEGAAGQALHDLPAEEQIDDQRSEDGHADPREQRAIQNAAVLTLKVE